MLIKMILSKSGIILFSAKLLPLITFPAGAEVILGPPCAFEIYYQAATTASVPTLLALCGFLSSSGSVSMNLRQNYYFYKLCQTNPNCNVILYNSNLSYLFEKHSFLDSWNCRAVHQNKFL